MHLLLACGHGRLPYLIGQSVYDSVITIQGDPADDRGGPPHGARSRWREDRMRFFEGFDQISYVTSDLRRGMEILQREFELPTFNVQDVRFAAKVGDVSGEMHIEVAVSAFDGMKVELVRPLADVGQLYSHR